MTISITNCIFETSPPKSLFPKTSRWNRKYNAISELYYYWTVTIWKSQDPAIVDYINDGTLEETPTDYIIKKSFVLIKKSIHLDKPLIISDEKLDFIINNCHIIHKKIPYTISSTITDGDEICITLVP